MQSRQRQSNHKAVVLVNSLMMRRTKRCVIALYMSKQNMFQADRCVKTKDDST